ncbi:MAG: tellurite resistance TerB family protein [Planctomycetaceae bacterium]|nr:tellurite resistance TerB family protein [Planctomycetaceae bacterium]
MDLFDEEFGSFTDKQPIGPHEGFAGVLLCASACDGHIADEEVQSLVVALTRMKMYQNVSPNQFNGMMDRLLGMLKRGGPEKLLNSVAPAVPPELRETAFANSCNIVLADGVVEDEEKEFMNTLMRHMEIEETRARQIIKVMVIKNKG